MEPSCDSWQKARLARVGTDSNTTSRHIEQRGGPTGRKDTEVIELLTKTTGSERYAGLQRPRILYRDVVNRAVQKGWGVTGANRRLEAVDPCPLTLAEATRDLDAEDLAIFFITFPSMLRSWKVSVADKHDALIESYRKQVKAFHEQQRELKGKNVGAVGVWDAFGDWGGDPEVGDAVECGSTGGGPENSHQSSINGLVSMFAEKETEIAALRARVEHSTSAVGGAAVTAMTPTERRRNEPVTMRLSADETTGLRDLLAAYRGEGVTEVDVAECAREFGLAGLLK